MYTNMLYLPLLFIFYRVYRLNRASASFYGHRIINKINIMHGHEVEIDFL